MQAHSLKDMEYLQKIAEDRFSAMDRLKGTAKGVKRRILKENLLSLFSPCGVHSLNVIGLNTAEVWSQIMTFFGSVQALFLLFAANPSSWTILLKEISVSLIPLSERRWCSRIHAVRPISLHHTGLLKAVDHFTEETASELTVKAFNAAQ